MFWFWLCVTKVSALQDKIIIKYCIVLHWRCIIIIIIIIIIIFIIIIIIIIIIIFWQQTIDMFLLSYCIMS